MYTLNSAVLDLITLIVHGIARMYYDIIIVIGH